MTLAPTNMPGNVSNWSYAQIGGSLPIPAGQMPQVGLRLAAVTSAAVTSIWGLDAVLCRACKPLLRRTCVTELISTDRCCTQDAATWPALANMQLCWALPFVYATHICSYSCFLSQFVPGASNGNACWLSQQPAGTPGSQCAAWPSNYPQPTGMALGIQAGQYSSFPQAAGL